MTTERTDSAHEQTESLSYLLACLLAVVLGVFFSLSGSLRGYGGVVPFQLQTRVNPNDAPAASLVRLPQIGVSRAEKIIAYRQSRAGGKPVFRCADDLKNVKGIGPAIVAGLAEYLTFED